MRPAAVVALAVLLVLAGCSVAPDGETEAVGSATPAPVPTDTPTPTPAREVPGLTLDGVGDADALAGAHETGLAAESYTYDFERSRRLGNRIVAAYSVEGVVSIRYGDVGDTRVAPPWPANATRATTSEP